VCSCSAGEKCSRPGKHPVIKDWPSAATTNLQIIAEWFKPGVCRNVGIVTGKRSGVMVVDIDRRNGGEISFAKLIKASACKQTIRSRTGGGRHLFFEYDEQIGTSQGKAFGQGIDVRADGGMVVMPPSLHASGKNYVWHEGRAPGTVLLSRIPSQWLSQSPTILAQKIASSSTPEGQHSEGSRNNFLASIAGTLVNGGSSPEAVLAALIIENQRACRPPLAEAEVQQIAASISRYPVHASSDEAELFSHVVMDRYFNGGEHLIFAPDHRLWRFSKTQWSPMEDETLAKIVLQCSNAPGVRPKMSKTALIQQVRVLLRAHAASEGDPLRFYGAPLQVINCRNGELWLQEDGSVELKAHDAKSYLRHTLQVDYDPKALCPAYSKTILEIFGNSKDPSGLRDFWHEFCGYALQPSRRCALIMIGKGNGSNGKTVLTGTLVNLLGYELVIAKPVQDLEKDRFGTAHLLGKYLLIDDDVKAGTRLPDGALKKLSEEKLLTGEHKYGAHFSFVSRVIPLLLCNNFPTVADLSPGLQRRLAVVPFDRSFLKKDEDPQLFKRIWATEMSGILNLYLAGLQRVIRRGWRFEQPKAVADATRDFLQGANPLPEFIAAMCRRGIRAHCRVEFMYENFVTWTKANGITYAQQQSSFRKNLENLGFTIVKRNDGIHVVGVTIGHEEDE
jgi:P4 family phage/plasmid primase-like protien